MKFKQTKKPLKLKIFEINIFQSKHISKYISKYISNKVSKIYKNWMTKHKTYYG